MYLCWYAKKLHEIKRMCNYINSFCCVSFYSSYYFSVAIATVLIWSVKGISLVCHVRVHMDCTKTIGIKAKMLIQNIKYLSISPKPYEQRKE